MKSDAQHAAEMTRYTQSAMAIRSARDAKPRGDVIHHISSPGRELDADPEERVQITRRPGAVLERMYYTSPATCNTSQARGCS